MRSQAQRSSSANLDDFRLASLHLLTALLLPGEGHGASRGQRVPLLRDLEASWQVRVEVVLSVEVGLQVDGRVERKSHAKAKLHAATVQDGQSAGQRCVMMRHLKGNCDLKKGFGKRHEEKRLREFAMLRLTITLDISLL